MENFKDLKKGYNEKLNKLKDEYTKYTDKWKRSLTFFSDDSYFKFYKSYENHVNWLLALNTAILIIAFTNINNFFINDELFFKQGLIGFVSLFVISLAIFFILKFYYFYLNHLSIKHVQLIHRCIYIIGEELIEFPSELSHPEKVEEQIRKVQHFGNIYSIFENKTNTSGKKLDSFRKLNNYMFFVYYPALTSLCFGFVLLFNYMFRFICAL